MSSPMLSPNVQIQPVLHFKVDPELQEGTANSTPPAREAIEEILPPGSKKGSQAAPSEPENQRELQTSTFGSAPPRPDAGVAGNGVDGSMNKDSKGDSCRRTYDQPLLPSGLSPVLLSEVERWDRPRTFIVTALGDAGHAEHRKPTGQCGPIGHDASNCPLAADRADLGRPLAGGWLEPARRETAGCLSQHTARAQGRANIARVVPVAVGALRSPPVEIDSL